MTPPNTTETDHIRSIYNRLAPEWDSRQGRSERLLMGDGMRQTLARHLRGDVLEVGAGTGATLRQLTADSGIASFTGVDLSPGMLQQAQSLADDLPFPATLREMDAEHLDFPDDSFDTVTASLIFCTVPDPARGLLEMSRVCKPDGHIVLLEHVRAPNPLLAGLQKLLTPLQHRMVGCHLDRPTDRLVQELGFRIDHEETRLFGIFHLMVARPPA